MTDSEINDAVARKLGYRVGYVSKGDNTFGAITKVQNPLMLDHWSPLPDYCQDIAAAWEIVEHLSKKYFAVSVSHDNLRELWQCGIETVKEPGEYETADTAPMAICLAFLKLA